MSSPTYTILPPDTVGLGAYGFVRMYDDTHVIKYPYEDEDYEACVISHEVEKAVFKRLMANDHPHIVRCKEIHEVGIVMEKLGSTLRHTLSNNNGQITMETRLRWAKEAAKALAHLHSLNVLHGDISSYNFLLDEKNHVKCIDFSGSCVDGVQSYAAYPTRNTSPEFWDNYQVTVPSEIFALGSVLYEIESGNQPYQDLKRGAIERLIRARQFPDVEAMIMGEVIMNCWNQNYQDMGSVCLALNVLNDAQSKVMADGV